MWFKSFAAMILGLLLSVSFMLNLNYLLPVAVDIRLFVSLVSAFCFWLAVMVYCYSRNSARAAVFGCGQSLLVSGTVNVYFFMAG
ncbi:hypothetical protein [Thalassomonas actiniarum]|uniref:Uncharacterized protein n=1 Tax=Thalassomonas actiniarum TaxID=485447 RepID=A0AAE9YSR9_9GAMM|nr:hypothetical protein [Thalassomonas actiniarum]WDD99763.1 hypothetical protein SG35_003580 [Thalassomonas actiniarum]